jgi:ribose-phosphate pyrophosphokinase
MNIKLFRNFRELKTKQWIFPGGELGIKIEDPNLKLRYHEDTHQTVVCRAQNTHDLFSIALAKDALEQTDGKGLFTRLFLPYVPYARQDRVCDRGESFSLKVLANFINSLNFDEVIILDPHSDVTPALINNVKVISQFDIIRQWQEFKNRIGSNCVFVSPDAGGNKKTAKVAGYFNHNSFGRADKLRDLTNGNILETIVYESDFGKKDVIVVDDIADGAKTFIELAKVCKAKNCGKFVLYCTHGIFSKGTKLENIDEIWTTDSFRTDLMDVHIFPVEKFLTA